MRSPGDPGRTLYLSQEPYWNLPPAARPLERDLDREMSRYWSSLTHGLTPYVPGEQPRMTELVKLNTNENPLGPSPRALEAVRGEAADTLRLYPDPQASALRAALATYHRVRPEQVFVGNGSGEGLGHALFALLKD